MSDSGGYSEAIAELEEMAAQPVLPARQVGLNRARRLLEEVGDPHRSYRVAHVTGSSGKGSTTTMIGSILEAAGLRTGYLRSPHLSSYTERIAVGARPIPEEDWARIWQRLRPLIRAMARNELPGYAFGRPSFSEAIFALASLYFREQGVEWAALEVGLGGRYDATNVVQSDVAVVTAVSLEHTQVLGSTVESIAAEKAAIIKSAAPAVTGVTDEEGLGVIEAQAGAVGAPLLRVPADIPYRVCCERLEGTQVEIDLRDGAVIARLAFAGGFQAHNAAVAAAAAVALRHRGIPLTKTDIVHGLERARLPGRLEVASRQPLVILDGAHHPAAVAALRASLDHLLSGTRPVLLFGALNDKNVAKMATHFTGLAGTIVLTAAPGTPRALHAGELAKYFEGSEARLLLEDDPDRALALAIDEAGATGTVIVCGSLYLVGHVRENLLRSGVSP